MNLESLKKDAKNKKTSVAQRIATEKYEAKTKVGLYLKLNKNTDVDILTKLNTISNKQGYIKELIRKDIAE